MSGSVAARAWARREAPLVTVVSATGTLATLFGILGWTELLIGVLCIGAVAAVVCIVVQIARSRAEGKQDREASERLVRVPVAPVHRIAATAIGVDPAALRILPGKGDIPTYVPRSVDASLNAAVRSALDGNRDEKWIVVVHGPPKVGKSRTLYESLVRVEAEGQNLVLVAPRDGAAVQTLLEPGQLRREADKRYVVWLDDLEVFVADGVTLDTVREWHDNWGAIVVATYGGKGGERVRDKKTNEFSVLAETILSFAERVGLGPTSPAELTHLPANLPEQDRGAIADYGLAAALVAAPKLETKFDSKQHGMGEPVSEEGVAVVRAAVDWSLCGRTDPIDKKTLRELWPTYLKQGETTDERFDSGLKWALEPVAGTISLLSGSESFQAFDYIVAHVAEDPNIPPPPDAAWQQALDTDDPGQLFDVGGVAYLEGREHDAERALAAASKGEDSQVAAVANVNFGVLRQGKGDLEGAEKAFRRAAAMNSAAGASNLGVLLWKLGELEEAETALRQAIELENLSGAWANLGGVLDALGDPKGAEAAFRKAAKMGEATGAANLGRLLKKQGEEEAAETAFAEAAELGDGGSALILGLSRLERGDLAGARGALQRAGELGEDVEAALAELEKEPPSEREGEVAFDRGVELLDRDDPAGAIDAFREATELGSGIAASNLGVLLEQQGDPVEAEAAYREATALGSPVGAFHLGLLLKEKGDLKGSEDACRTAAALGSPTGASNLGVLLAERGDLEGAEKAYRRAIKLGGSTGAFNLAELLERRGESEEARIARQIGSDLEDPEA